MRIRLFALTAAMVAAGICAPSLARTTTTAVTTAGTSRATAMCIRTPLNPDQCQAIPCPVSKFCPPIGSAPAAALTAAEAPSWYCSPTIQPVCAVIGFVLCRKPFTCPEAALTAATTTARLEPALT